MVWTVRGVSSDMVRGEEEENEDEDDRWRIRRASFDEIESASFISSRRSPTLKKKVSFPSFKVLSLLSRSISDYLDRSFLPSSNLSSHQRPRPLLLLLFLPPPAKMASRNPPVSFDSDETTPSRLAYLYCEAQCEDKANIRAAIQLVTFRPVSLGSCLFSFLLFLDSIRSVKKDSSSHRKKKKKKLESKE